MLVKFGRHAGVDVKILGYKGNKISCMVGGLCCDDPECEEDVDFFLLSPREFGFRNLKEFHDSRTKELTVSLNAERASYRLATLGRPSKKKQKEILECIKV